MKMFATRLVEERHMLGYGVRDLARLGGVRAQVQRRYEEGACVPDAVYLSLLADQGIDVLYLLTGERSASCVSQAKEAQLDDDRFLDARGHADYSDVGQSVPGPIRMKDSTLFNASVGQCIQGNVTYNNIASVQVMSHDNKKKPYA